MHLDIVTPDKKIYEGEVSLVQVPGTKGLFEILRNHAPIISTLEEGSIKIVDDKNKIQYFSITSGVIEVKDNDIIVLAETT
jgi:F-type H+-transporting ATPase subunit epsilon